MSTKSGAGVTAPQLLQPSRDDGRRALALSWRALLELAEAEASAAAAGTYLGAYCVNRSLFEDHVRPFTTMRERGRIVPLPPEWWGPETRALLGRIARTFDAWRLAEAEYAAGRRASPAFAILDLAAVTAPRDRRKPSRRRLTPEQRAGQRHRYKGAMADVLEAFARPHLRPDPRAGLFRPRWLDHRPECMAGRGIAGVRPCSGCARVPIPPPPRWRRAPGRRRRRDYLTMPEWLLDRAAAARSCQSVVGLQDARCGGVVVVPQSCRVRTCPDCEAARQTRVVNRYRSAVQLLDPDRTGFLTITVKSPRRHELAGGLLKLSADLERLKRRALWRGGRCRDRGSCSDRSRAHRRSCRREACPSWQPGTCRQPWDPGKPGWRIPHEPITADMTTLEHTYNADAKLWHPHLHLIVEGRIDQAELADTWEAITGDSRIVWIESVARHAADRWAGDVEGALRELLKYAAKPSPAFLQADDPSVIAELLVALRGRRLTSTSGRLYGLGLEDEEEPDLVLVWPPGDDPRPYHAPRLCPHHGAEAEWRILAASIRRRDCTAAPDLSRPGRSILTWTPPSDGDGSAG